MSGFSESATGTSISASITFPAAIGAVIQNWPAVIGVSGSLNVTPVYSNTPQGVSGTVTSYNPAPVGVTGSVNVTVSGSTGLLVSLEQCPPAGTGALTVLSGVLASTTLLTANTSRKGMFFYADDNNPGDVFIRFGTPCQPTLYTMRLNPGSSYESGGGYVFDGAMTYCTDNVSSSLYCTEMSA